MILIDTFVEGRPRTKGSLKPIVNWASQKVMMVEQVGLSTAWRRTVSNHMVALVARKEGKGWRLMNGWPRRKAVSVALVFVFEREHGDGDEWPVKVGYGDVDKLTRNVLDALTDAKVYADDSLVRVVTARKVFVGDAEDRAGVRVTVEGLDEEG